MTHAQQSLSTFDGKQHPKQRQKGDQAPKIELPDEARTVFATVPENYPVDAIDVLSTASISANLCTQDGTVDPVFETIAGSGGMGPSGPIETPGEVHDITSKFVGLPVMVTGGGMSTPMGSGAIFALLNDAHRDDDLITIEIEELYRQRGRSRNERSTKRLGSYEVSIPRTARDCRKAIIALSAWKHDRIDHLDPAKRQAEQVRQERLESFSELSPGDKLDISTYATRLDVVSEPFETHAIIPRGSLSQRSVKVTAVTANNPRGGYCQIGIETTNTPKSGNEPPTCYVSRSSKSPQAPNTAFPSDGSFESTELEILSIEHPPDPEVVPPDQDRIESPLPDPLLQTPIDEIDGIGEKTSWKLRRKCENRVTAESVAHTLLENGEIHREHAHLLKQTLDALPRSDYIFEQLKNYTTGGP